jgi:hypothetical protein
MILLPWIHNIELIDPSLPKGVHGQEVILNEEQGNAFLQGLGWGSVQSTELVLNNLFYLTATVGFCLFEPNRLFLSNVFSSRRSMHQNSNCYGMP